MLRAVADQPTFWERFLPKELRRLSMELGVSKKDGLAWWYPTPDHRPGGYRRLIGLRRRNSWLVDAVIGPNRWKTPA